MTVIGQPEAPVVPINMYWKKKALMAFFFLICVGSVGFGVKTKFFPTCECMEWEKDHYEPVVCTGISRPGLDSLNTETLLKFKQIQVNKNTVFYKNGKPVFGFVK